MTGQSQSSQGAKALFEQRLRALAKNLQAISKGRGKPGDVVDQIVEVAESLIAFDEAFGMRPQDELIRRALANLHEGE
jgi:hypothetical protein